MCKGERERERFNLYLIQAHFLAEYKLPTIIISCVSNNLDRYHQ